MKKLLLMSLFSTLLLQPVFARTVEVEVHGMTCPFCVDSLEREFGKMESVSKVEVSLKLKKVRLETEADSPGLETIRKTIIDAGFTPIKITVPDDEKTSK